jgi:hypothetical protein
MLFHLEFRRELTELSADALSNPISALINAHRSGTHFVVIDRQTAKWLGENVDLSRRDLAMLDRIAQEFTQAGSLRNRAGVYVRLSADPTSHLDRQGNAITIALQRLTACRILERTVLLLENAENDGNLYEFLLRNHCDLHGISHIEFDRSHGGGADLSREFVRLMRARRIVYATIDSDADSPYSPNSKLQALAREAAQERWPLGFSMSPPCREAENLVPMEIVMGLQSGFRNPTNQIMLEVERLERGAGERPEHYYWLFFDLKLGLTSQRFRELSPNDGPWVLAKLQLAKCDPNAQDVGGYGERVVPQLFAANRMQSDLRNKTRQHDWRDVFAAFLDGILWPMIAARKVVT